MSLKSQHGMKKKIFFHYNFLQKIQDYPKTIKNTIKPVNIFDFKKREREKKHNL